MITYKFDDVEAPEVATEEVETPADDTSEETENSDEE